VPDTVVRQRAWNATSLGTYLNGHVPRPSITLGGGRSWWAHLTFTRINIAPTILRKEIEDLREARPSISVPSWE
jgi:hypothetical protein